MTIIGACRNIFLLITSLILEYSYYIPKEYLLIVNIYLSIYLLSRNKMEESG